MKFTTNLPMYVVETRNGFFFNAKGEACLISITEPGYPEAKLKDDGYGWADILRIAFWDVTQTLERGISLAGHPDERIDPLTDEQAKLIADFIKKYMDRDIIVHCKAGVSRSAAIARLLNEMGWNKHRIGVHDTSGYNVVVYNKVKRNFPELLPAGAE